MPIHAIIVDDEPLARDLINEYLHEYPEIEVVAQCSNGRQAIEAINARAPDLVFLDVQMPGLNGFDVLEALAYLPHIVFSTAHDDFALQAFETGAVDYLLKPYNRGRFRKAVERVIRQHRLRQDPSERLAALLQARQTTYLDRLFVRVGDKIVPVQADDILWIEAAGDYSKLYTETQGYLCNLGIGALEARLDPARFARVHRSALIALAALEHFASDGEGGYIATLRNRDQVRVSRSYAPKIRDYIL